MSPRRRRKFQPQAPAPLRDEAVLAQLTQWLQQRPRLAAQAFAALDRKARRAVIGDPSALLPVRPRRARLEPEFKAVQFASLGIQRLLQGFAFDTVLDVGAGAGQHSAVFAAHGKEVTALDFDRSVYAAHQDETAGAIAAAPGHVRRIVADANDVDLAETFDCVWASHVLEHQPNVGRFIARLKAWAKPGGVIAITVPPAKFDVVGGHLSLWTPGHLLYNLVFAGIDCSQAEVMFYGYNITVIVRNQGFDMPRLDYDAGDITRLARWLPPQMHEGVGGFFFAGTTLSRASGIPPETP